MLTAQNTTLDTASLAPTERVVPKVTWVDGEWTTVLMIISDRADGHRSERPADGSANLLDAVRASRARAAAHRNATTE